MKLKETGVIAAVLLATAAVVLAYRSSETTPSLLRLDSSIHNPATGLRVGVETDLHGNLFGFARVEQAHGAPAVLEGAQLVVDGAVYPAVRLPDGSWRSTGPTARAAKNVRMEATEVGGAVRYYEAIGVK